jgi:hypothetical protein
MQFPKRSFYYVEYRAMEGVENLGSSVSHCSVFQRLSDWCFNDPACTDLQVILHRGFIDIASVL